MIKEDYVSFDTAKILKEKGFNPLNCGMYYSITTGKRTTELLTSLIACPTLQMTMKWLREMYGLMIVVHPSYPIDGIKYESLIYRLTELKDTSVDEYNYNDKEYDNYEQACESAIKYCIENLI